MKSIILAVHNVRSCHNVGSLFRTAEGLGVKKIYLSGYTPYPLAKDDSRLPHVAGKVNRQIQKTALGAEKMVPWEHIADTGRLTRNLKANGYEIIALEQNPNSMSLADYQPSEKIALVVGSEVGGLPDEIIKHTDKILEIPMAGRKESFNVAVAAGIALYHLTLLDK